MDLQQKTDWFNKLEKFHIPKEQTNKYFGHPDLLPHYAVWFMGLEHLFEDGEVGVVLGKNRRRIIVNQNL